METRGTKIQKKTDVRKSVLESVKRSLSGQRRGSTGRKRGGSGGPVRHREHFGVSSDVGWRYNY